MQHTLIITLSDDATDGGVCTVDHTHTIIVYD